MQQSTLVIHSQHPSSPWRILGVLLAISVPVATIAEPSNFVVRTRMGNMAIPIPRLADKAPADSAWEEVAALIALIPQVNVAPPFQEKDADWRGYIYWQEFSNRLLREVGADFYAQYPDDPRCWTWLQATLKREPQYLNLNQGWLAQRDPTIRPPIDDDQRSAWLRNYAELSDACIAADSAPEKFRVELWTRKLQRMIEVEAWARAQNKPFDFARVDFDQVGAGLDELGRKFPASGNEHIRIATKYFFRYALEYAPEVGAKWRTILLGNDNGLIREIAASIDHVARLKTNPMVLRFTAVDGREVDLEKLRGKVVLIDFWAATWCGACKVQKPLMKDVYGKYHAQGFEIIGIACEMKESDRQYLLDYVNANGMPWPQFFDGKSMRNEYTLRYGFTGIPQYFLLDQRGLLAAHTSSSQGLRNLEAVVRRHLGLAPLHPGDEYKQLGIKADQPD
ncbi:MAG TPA: TlpA disulfide reductase family protein [Opitutaceae bacterium]|nr:TlpA disulfide reductase family protein [Opitutaceae bacterium]HRJ46262.1 TlpA disulfide reductase family protein [Opitutaceae bacterium]